MQQNANSFENVILNAEKNNLQKVKVKFAINVSFSSALSVKPFKGRRLKEERHIDAYHMLCYRMLYFNLAKKKFILFSFF